MAFEGIDASELYPCVLFYSTIHGEKVISLSMLWFKFDFALQSLSKSERKIKIILITKSLNYIFFQHTYLHM